MKTEEFVDEIQEEATVLRRQLNEAYKEGHIDMAVKVMADSLCNDLQRLNVKRWVNTAAQRGRRVVALQEQVSTLRKLTAPQRPTSKRARKQAELARAAQQGKPGKQGKQQLPIRIIEGKYGRAAHIDLGSVRIEIMDLSKSKRGL